MKTKPEPEVYLLIRDCRSDELTKIPLKNNAKLDLKYQIKKWIKRYFQNAAVLNGELMPKVEGDYYAKLITDGRPIDTNVVWDSAGFFVRWELTR